MKKPKVGDRVVVYDTFWEKDVEGVVTDLLSIQFIYKPQDDFPRFAFYANKWRIVQDGVE